MGWGKGKQGGAKSRKPLPDSMKISVGNQAEAAAVGAYLMYRENANRRATHRNIDLCRGMFAVVDQDDVSAREMVALGARVSAAFDPKAFELEAPAVVDAVDAALEYALAQP